MVELFCSLSSGFSLRDRAPRWAKTKTYEIEYLVVVNLKRASVVFSRPSLNRQLVGMKNRLESGLAISERRPPYLNCALANTCGGKEYIQVEFVQLPD